MAVGDASLIRWREQMTAIGAKSREPWPAYLRSPSFSISVR